MGGGGEFILRCKPLNHGCYQATYPNESQTEIPMFKITPQTKRFEIKGRARTCQLDAVYTWLGCAGVDAIDGDDMFTVAIPRHPREAC